MTKGKYLILITLLLTLFSCEDNFDKYEKPAWLEGLLYTKMKTVDNIDTFTKCVELSGYNEVIDVSGSYTVFAPSDEAFELYLQSHAAYNTVEDIPQYELLALVKFHIVQNAWNREQLRKLDVNGWIDPKDEFNNKAWGYKRQTVLLGDDYRFGIVPDKGYNEWRLVDTTETTFTRRIINDTRKYAPIFYSDYFALHNLPLSDYSFYFDRSFENPDDIYFADAKLNEEYFADNGFIHVVDRVVEPMKNGYEILDSEEGNDYSEFLRLIQQFPELEYDSDKTFDQAGAEQGLQVDSLFELTFPDLAFDITSERTKAPAGGAGLPSEVTIRFHHGLVAPTNPAFEQFLDEYVRVDGGWGTLEFMPRRIKRIIANSYMSENA
ncbi:MAG: fasciclin domain-containing protein, partial [Prolixibacteraceae bacterium]|nr:fasciclin domain-containing protein [Prolixibacteraceae bacterium]